MTSQVPIIIVGAGISGLMAAHDLQNAGQDVILLEGQDQVGGRMTTVDWGGFKVDVGAKFITSADKSMLEVVRTIGLEDQLVRDESGLTITLLRIACLRADPYRATDRSCSTSRISANFLLLSSHRGAIQIETTCIPHVSDYEYNQKLNCWEREEQQNTLVFPS